MNPNPSEKDARCRLYRLAGGCYEIKKIKNDGVYHYSVQLPGWFPISVVGTGNSADQAHTNFMLDLDKTVEELSSNHLMVIIGEIANAIEEEKKTKQEND